MIKTLHLFVAASLTCLFATNSCGAEELPQKKGMAYGMLGLGFVETLNGGVGYRYYFKECEGIDVALEGSYLGADGTHVGTVGGNVHYINKPFRNKALYTGVGGMARYVDVKYEGTHINGVGLGPNFLLGREFCLRSGRKAFVQLDAGGFVGHGGIAPNVKISFGIGF